MVATLMRWLAHSKAVRLSACRAKRASQIFDLRQPANAQHIFDDAGVQVAPQSRESFPLGTALYGARPDKGYRLTDCISMPTMRKQRLTEVLTNDRHFEQEGSRASRPLGANLRVHSAVSPYYAGGWLLLH